MNSLLLKAIKDKVEKSGTASVKLLGHSMYPIIRSGEIITIEYCEFESVKIDDIVAYYFNNSDHFIVHRVIKIENIKDSRVLITKGDNNDYVDARAVKFSNYVGIVRKGIPYGRNV